ncbi:MAG: hypothetical protein Q9216_001103 [Gyalolechia sp. 2 TL-2023]
MSTPKVGEVPSPDFAEEKQNALSRLTRRRPTLSKRQKTLSIVVIISCFAIAFTLSLGLGLGLQHNHKNTSEQLVVDLGYARYRGSNSSGINRWLGMRYAATPTASLRFAAPVPPTQQKGIQSAIKHGDKCLPVRATNTSKSTSSSYSEDCIFVEVYAPANATAESLLPVYVYLEGGGFVKNDGSYNGASLIKASAMQLIVVNLNYRVAPYGFLASHEIREGGSLNNGLKDQRQALIWIQQHISKVTHANEVKRFGGNPKHIVLGGSSAGAASITFQLIAYGGKKDSLFHATAAESQSFGALRTVEESQYQYDELVARTKCDSARTKDNDTLSCLRNLSSDVLQAQNIGTPFPDTTLPPLFAYNPTLDYDFIPNQPVVLFSAGQFLKLPATYGDTTNEGTIFAPRNISTPRQSNDWIQAQFPLLNATQKDYLTENYPPTTETWPKTGRYWRSTADAYGELRYICPGIFLSNVYANHSVKRNWNYRYAVLDPTDEKRGLGTPHVAELNAIWGAPAGSPPSYKTGNANMIPVLQQYWISFIRTMDPNRYRLEGTPEWEEWGARGFEGEGEVGRRILFQSGEGKKTEMENVDQKQWDRCTVLSGWGVGLGQ